ncbi:MAG TPA: tRNA guanosine(34) transglycosylase Tgt, partial [Alphaproteobacteria bacterium]|nr:tRNA guanosine(34) transglycosylase Tgt [Alphaproteobacteria bacterium]
MRWAKRSRDAWVDRPGYGIYGIAQGSTFADLREESIRALEPMDFHGIAVGGLAVGEGQELMFKTLDDCEPHLPQHKPRYLMGVGKPLDLVGAVRRGIDQFDCVLPTRSGRTGQAFTWRGPINMRNARHQDDPRPIDEDCSCPACRNYSRAYIRHLHRADEMLGAMLLSWHNIQHYQDLMARMRSAIEAGAFADFEAGVVAGYARGDIDPL